jgi:hypothetical protein
MDIVAQVPRDLAAVDAMVAGLSPGHPRKLDLRRTGLSMDVVFRIIMA